MRACGEADHIDRIVGVQKFWVEGWVNFTIEQHQTGLAASYGMSDSPLNDALRSFESTEANLVKLERLWSELSKAIPKGISFDSDPDYEINIRAFQLIWAVLPKLNGWKPEIVLFQLDEIAQSRFDAQECGELYSIMGVECSIDEPGKQLREYRFRFNQIRRELTREALSEQIACVDSILKDASLLIANSKLTPQAIKEAFSLLKPAVDQINTLIGSSISKPERWSDLHRHLHFAMDGDLHDIIDQDWPSVKTGLNKSLYGEKDAVPVGIEDLGSLVRQKPTGSVATKLEWGTLSEDEFQRFVFVLISNTPGYENPEWLTHTNAPDKGRDLSVYRVIRDPLGGISRIRVIIQCKHWLTKSVAPTDIALLEAQMMLWEPPRVDVVILATTGRFTSDAVLMVEKKNISDKALKIEMWPETHLERIVAERPWIIGEFHLR